jgi:protein-S-isoprenylcysteine O-methyltransferase Ste14
MRRFFRQKRLLLRRKHLMGCKTGGTGIGLLAKWLDWPPVWTLACLALVWLVSRISGPFGMGEFGRGLAVACLLAGLGLMAAAVWQMAKARTTVNPRGEPSALVTTGVFALSRNPIYLGDALVVLAGVFWWDAPLALLVVALFVSVTRRRFIAREETRLIQRFGAEAEAWFARVRRWL